MSDNSGWLVIRKEQATAFGKMLDGNGFLVRAGSTAMREGLPNVKRNRPERDRLVVDGILVPDENPALFQFAKDHVFSSKSAAAGVVIDGNSNGDHWRDDDANGLDLSVAAQQALLDSLTRTEIDAAMRECDASGLEGFLARGGFARPQVWFRAGQDMPNYPAKATVAAALAFLPDGLALSAKEFFNGFGESQAFATLERLGYEIVRNDANADAITWNRDAIEAAMDAFDRYRETGAHAEIFTAFGEPRDYWV